MKGINRKKSREVATGGVLFKKMFLKISQYSQGERPVLESLFNKIAGLKEYCDIFEKTYFEEDLQLAASEGTLKDT